VVMKSGTGSSREKRAAGQENLEGKMDRAPALREGGQETRSWRRSENFKREQEPLLEKTNHTRKPTWETGRATVPLEDGAEKSRAQEPA
jgi:hypothetical protein